METVWRIPGWRRDRRASGRLFDLETEFYRRGSLHDGVADPGGVSDLVVLDGSHVGVARRARRMVQTIRKALDGVACRATPIGGSAGASEGRAKGQSKSREGC